MASSPVTIQLEKKLLGFQNKILRKICDPVFDSELNVCRKKPNIELR